MKTKSIHLLWLVLPLACSGPPSPDADLVATPGISIRPQAFRPLFVGGARQLVADATGGAVTWQSSNPEVAAVGASGLARGISAGTATITATVSSPNGTSAAASIGITVRPPTSGDAIASRRHARH